VRQRHLDSRRDGRLGRGGRCRKQRVGLGRRLAAEKRPHDEIARGNGSHRQKGLRPRRAPTSPRAGDPSAGRSAGGLLTARRHGANLP